MSLMFWFFSLNAKTQSFSQSSQSQNKLKTTPSPLALIGMEIIFISFSKRDKNIAMDSR